MDSFKSVHESHFLCLCAHCAASGTVGSASRYTLHSFGLFHLPVSGLWRFKIQTSYHFISIFKIMYLKDKDYKKESIDKLIPLRKIKYLVNAQVTPIASSLIFF